jgi:SdrD B-like domain
MEERTFRISGRVIDQRNQGVAGLRVEAWDKELIRNDLVGSAVTGDQGMFQITLSESYFQELFETRRPDLFFTVSRGSVLIKDTRDSVLWNVGAGDTYVGDIVVETPQTSGGTPPTTTIKGTISFVRTGDEPSEAISGLEVIARKGSPKSETEESDTTGTAGEFTIHIQYPDQNPWFVVLPPEINRAGLPKLRLSEPDFASIRVQVKSGGESNIGEILYKAPGGFVRGTIFVDKAGNQNPANQPRLSGLQVTLSQATPSDVEEKKTRRVVTTDAQGIYTFDDPEPGRYRLSVDRKLDAAKFGVGKGTLTLPDDLPPLIHFESGDEVTQDLGYILIGGDVRGIVFLDDDGDGRRFGDEPGIAGVPVVLGDANKTPLIERLTEANGEYRFLNIQPPGTYTLLFQDSAGEELTLTTPGTQQVTVILGETFYAQPTGYKPEVHEIRGQVVFEDDTPVVGLVVTLLDAGADHQELDTAVTDENGFYVFEDREGEFLLRFPERPFEGQLLTPKERPASVESIFNVPKTVYRLAADGGGGATVVSAAGGTLQDAVSDIASYMPTAQEVTSPMPRRGTGGATGAPASLQQVVDGALTEVLGRKRTDEPKAFLASLERSFALEQFEGRTQFKWTPRTYAVQTELGGGLTGAQASIYHRAKAALDDALPLLDGLYPLLSNVDQQEADAARSIVRTEFIELVNEVGVEGGPRPQRVDDIFSLLRARLDGDPPTKSVRVVFGLTPSSVITVEEEQNLTNFLVIRDYVEGLFTTWNSFKGQFTSTDTSPKALGTQLVLLSRALSVVAEAVDETNAVMDSVFLGPNERQTVSITFPRQVQIEGRLVPTLTDLPGQPPPSMVVDELMSWVGRFAKDEAPQLIQEGGKRGVEAILPIAERLERLVIGAAQPGASTHIGFSRQRVRRSLIELANQLGQVRRFASELLRNGNLNA